MFGKVKRLSLTLAALAGAAVGGAALAGAATSNNGSTAAKAAAPSLPALPPPGVRNMPAPGSASHEDAEKAVTGDAATKAQAAAVKAAGSGTAGDVTSTFDGGGYEVTVTKADGSSVEYHLDSSYTVMTGPAPGGPQGFGC
jgi:hypothetical protein